MGTCSQSILGCTFTELLRLLGVRDLRKGGKLVTGDYKEEVTRNDILVTAPELPCVTDPVHLSSGGSNSTSVHLSEQSKRPNNKHRCYGASCDC